MNPDLVPERLWLNTETGRVEVVAAVPARRHGPRRGRPTELQEKLRLARRDAKWARMGYVPLGRGR